MSSPTQRSLALLRKDGWTVCIVEKWVPQARKTIDAFGFGDCLACRPGDRISLIQTTSASNIMARYHKILSLPEAEVWLRSGGLIFVHGWAKRGGFGKRKLWSCTVKEITLLEMKAQRDELLQASPEELTV